LKKLCRKSNKMAVRLEAMKTAHMALCSESETEPESPIPLKRIPT